MGTVNITGAKIELTKTITNEILINIQTPLQGFTLTLNKNETLELIKKLDETILEL